MRALETDAAAESALDDFCSNSTKVKDWKKSSLANTTLW